MPVYDEEKQGTKNDSGGPSIRPNLNVAGGTGGSSKADAAKAKYGEAGKSSSLQAREQNAGMASQAAKKASDVVGKGFNPELQTAKEAINAVKHIKNALWGTKDRKRNSIIGGTGVTIVTLLGVGFLFFLPNEVISLVSQTNSRFLNTSESEVDKEVHNETNHWLTNRLEKFAGADCAGVTSFVKCLAKQAIPKNPDPVEEAYETWDQSGLAESFSEDGVNFVKSGDRILMKSDALPEGSLDVTGVNNVADLPESAQNILSDAIEKVEVPEGSWLHGTPGSPDDFVDLIKSLVGQDTDFSDICATPGDCSQEIADEKAQLAKDPNDPEAFAKAKLEVAVDDPTEAVVGDAATCMLDAQCDPQQKPEPDSGESAQTDANAGDETDFDREAASSADAAEGAAAGEDLSTLAETSDTEAAEGTEGIVNIVIEQMLKAVGVDATAATAKEVLSQAFEKIAGPVGWVLGASAVIQLLHDAGPKVRALDAAIMTTMVVKTFILYATTGDEQKSTNTDLGLEGSMNGSIAGGTSSPAYSYFLDPHNTKETASTTHTYLDSRNLAFGSVSNAITGLSDEWNKIPGTGPISSLAGYVSNSVNYVLGPIIGFFLNLPGIKQAVNYLVSLIAPLLLDLMIKYVLHLPPKIATAISTDKVASIIVGGDKSGELANESIGGEHVSPAAMAQIVNEDQEAQVHQFEQRPLFARIFSTDTPYSLVMRLSIAMPRGLASTVQTTFAELLSNPLGKFASIFSTLLSPVHVFAAAAPQADPAGIPDIAIPDNTPVFTADPEQYWQQNNCSQQEAQDYPQWHASFTQFAPDGQTATNYDEWVPTTVNGCLLIQRASASGATLFGGTPE